MPLFTKELAPGIAAFLGTCYIAQHVAIQTLNWYSFVDQTMIAVSNAFRVGTSRCARHFAFFLVERPEAISSSHVRLQGLTSPRQNILAFILSIGLLGILIALQTTEIFQALNACECKLLLVSRSISWWVNWHVIVVSVSDIFVSSLLCNVLAHYLIGPYC